VHRWLRPLQTDPGVRHDLARYARNARRSQMLDVCDRLRSFGRPVLVIWAPEDRVQHPTHGPRLAALLPNARLTEIHQLDDDDRTGHPDLGVRRTAIGGGTDETCSATRSTVRGFQAEIAMSEPRP